MNKSPSLDLEERAPYPLNFDRVSFLVAAQKAFQTHTIKSKNKVNRFWGTPFDRVLKYLFLTEIW